MLRPLKLTVPPERLWLTSDCHFHHDKPWIVQARGFQSVEEHDEGLIARWNERVEPEDTVIHLGDFIARSDAAGFWAVVRQLTFGHLYMLEGNHQSGSKQAYTNTLAGQFPQCINDGRVESHVYPIMTGILGRPVTFLPEYVEVNVAKQNLVLCHYPLRSWHHMRSSEVLHCFGHTHNNLKMPIARSRDVGIDAYGGPVSLAQLLREMKSEVAPTVDHHGGEGIQ